MRKNEKNGFAWNTYFDGEEIVYTAVPELESLDAKPRIHGRSTNIRDAKSK
jgi:hypothetical protein